MWRKVPQHVPFCIHLNYPTFRGGSTDITSDGKGVTLEFFNFAGKTVAIVPLYMKDVRAMDENEVMHARSVKSA